MAKKLDKTNAARLLDRAGLQYNLVPYEVDENDLAAQHVADSLGQDIAKVFKTLVLHGDKTGYIVCVIPGDKEVDLKAETLKLFHENVEPFRKLWTFDRFVLDDSLIGLSTTVDIVGLNREHLLERGSGAVSFERPDFHFPEALTTVLSFTTEWLLGDHGVRTGRAGVDFIVDHVVEF